MVSAVFGGGVLIVQLLLSVFGLGGEHDVAHAGSTHELTHGAGPDNGDAGHHSHARLGSTLLSIRGIAAGLAFFGLAGLGAMRLGWPTPLAVAAGIVAGVIALAAVAAIMTALLRFESDGSLTLTGAIGEPAEVYIPIPGDGTTPGKVLLALQGRTVECDAVISGTQADALPTGSGVTVVDVQDDGLLVVVPATNPLSEVH